MIEIDITADIDRAEKTLLRFERTVLPKAISSAINKTRTNLQTAVNQKLAQRTGLKIKEIKAAQWGFRSTAITQFATLTMRRRAFNLRRFVTPGKLRIGGFAKLPGVIASPWRKKRTFRGAFIIRGETHGKLIVVRRTSGNRYPLKGMYGPSLHIEFNRPIIRRFMRAFVLKRFRVNFERDLNFFVGKIR